MVLSRRLLSVCRSALAVNLMSIWNLLLKQGMPLAEAVIDAGAARFRPMTLTAAVVVGGVLTKSLR